MLYNLFENRDFVSVFAVALLAEGVDRNVASFGTVDWAKKSPSSRRAWIEISGDCSTAGSSGKSPSSRRTWIEISFHRESGIATIFSKRSFPCIQFPSPISSSPSWTTLTSTRSSKAASASGHKSCPTGDTAFFPAAHFFI